MIIRTLFLLILFSSCHSAKTSMAGPPLVSSQDLSMLIGEWTGSLTYLNYTNNEPYTMPANLNITRGKSDHQLTCNNIYPNEPHANNRYAIVLSESGTHLNQEKITSRTELPNGVVQVITESPGMDDNKSALIRQSYHISNDTFTMKKEVQYKLSQGWIRRNEFSYRRKQGG